MDASHNRHAAVARLTRFNALGQKRNHLGCERALFFLGSFLNARVERVGHVSNVPDGHLTTPLLIEQHLTMCGCAM